VLNEHSLVAVFATPGVDILALSFLAARAPAALVLDGHSLVVAIAMPDVDALVYPVLVEHILVAGKKVFAVVVLFIFVDSTEK